MSSINKKAKPHTKSLSVKDSLRRSVMTSLLWEDNFYEDGESIVDRIRGYVKKLPREDVLEIMYEAKFTNNLRHMPLYLILCLAENNNLKSEDVEKVVTRVDDMTELVSLYFSFFRKANSLDTDDKRNGAKLPKQLVKGLKKSFTKFDEYQFAKYQSLKKEVKLSDVLKLVRPKPTDDSQAELWGKILSKTLKTPDTWEVELSATKDKKASWERLLTEKTDKGFNKVGSLALLRNLRNIIGSDVSDSIIKNAIKSSNMNKILPFQIVNAAQYAPKFSDLLENKFVESLEDYKALDGETIILLDSSGSMDTYLSGNSEITRELAGACVAAMCKHLCDSSIIYKFDTELELISSHLKDFSLIDELMKNIWGGTSVISCTNKAIRDYKNQNDSKFPKRVIIITDEQTNSDLSSDKKLINLPDDSFGYIINVSNYENGITTYGNWTSISGWSDGIIKYISEIESLS